LVENLPNACPPAACVLPLCGDGVTQDGEMCDGGIATCMAPAFNAPTICQTASDCKNPPGNTADLCATVSSLTGGAANRDDVPSTVADPRCRSNCMPATCGDGVSDVGEACEPPASGTFCIRNTFGQCVLNTCGDGDVCNKDATDVCLTKVSGNCVPGLRHCDTGPVVSVATGQCTGLARLGAMRTRRNCATTGTPCRRRRPTSTRAATPAVSRTAATA